MNGQTGFFMNAEKNLVPVETTQDIDRLSGKPSTKGAIIKGTISDTQ
jgi:hypothetical protein